MLPIYAAIESMSIADSLVISLLGFAIVFAALIVIAFMIKLISIIVGAIEGTGKKKAAAPAAAPVAAAAPAANADMVPAKGSLGELKLHNVDDKTAAMLMAIVADQMNCPLNEIRFLSIKEIEK